MLELNIKCTDLDEARVYLNAPQYHNLLTDLYAAFRQARKHGTDADVVKAVDTFYLNIIMACEHHTGPY
jgi:hypothetical protein